MSEQGHMAWCKARALEYLDRGGPKAAENALGSFASDVRKDASTDNETVRFLIVVDGMRHAAAGDVAGMRRFIEGFAE